MCVLGSFRILAPEHPQTLTIVDSGYRLYNVYLTHAVHQQVVVPGWWDTGQKESNTLTRLLLISAQRNITLKS